MRRDITPSDFAGLEAQHDQAEHIKRVLAPRRITPEIVRSLQDTPEHVYGPDAEDAEPMNRIAGWADFLMAAVPVVVVIVAAVGYWIAS